MARKQKLVQFQVTEAAVSRFVVEVAGSTVCVTTRVTTISPAAVSRADVQALAATAQQMDPGDPETWWKVELPGLNDTVEWSERDGLEEEVANALNNWGVSVADWSPYAL